jgi:hypothetical protein
VISLITCVIALITVVIALITCVITPITHQITLITHVISLVTVALKRIIAVFSSVYREMSRIRGGVLIRDGETAAFFGLTVLLSCMGVG